MKRRRSSLYAPLLKLAVCLAAGIAVGRYLAVDGRVWLAVLAAMIVVALLFWRKPKLQSAIVALCCGVLGVVLSARQRQQMDVEWPEEAITVDAVVTSEPVEKPKTVAVDLLLAGSGRRVKGYFHTDSLSRAIQVGDGLRLRARFRRGNDWQRGHFDYREYLETHGFCGTVFVRAGEWEWQQVSLGGRCGETTTHGRAGQGGETTTHGRAGQGRETTTHGYVGVSRWERARLRFLVWRHQLLGRLQDAGLDEEQYAVVAAMALGDKSALTKELKDVYGISGASHVLALSGLHLGIIYGLLSLFFSRRRRRVVPVLVSVLALWAFALLVGLHSSVVRAAVMLSVYMLFSLAGRNRTPINVLAFTAIVMLCCSPWSLFDVGFQLSFMAMFAILLLTPLFNGLMTANAVMNNRWLRAVWSLLSVSAAAQVGSAPLVAYYFGRFSTYFLLTNILVIPVATIVIYLSLLTLAVPACAVALTSVVRMLNTALSSMAALPFASIEGLHPTALQTVAAYVALAAGLAAWIKWRGDGG